MEYSESRKNFLYYKFVNNILSLLSIGKKSIIDVGSNGIDVLSITECEKKVSLDIDNPLQGEGILSVKQDFFNYTSDQQFDLVTCFQVLEHIDNAKGFAEKLLQLGKIIIVSVPYKWAKGSCKYHCQDPVDEFKLISWFNKNPIFVQCVQTRLVAIFLNNDKDIILNQVNGGNYIELFDFKYDLGSPFRRNVSTSFFNEEYKYIKIQSDHKLKLFSSYSPSEILDKALSGGADAEEIYLAGIEIYPFILDKYGHPLFLKEYIRYLVDNAKFDKAEFMLGSNTPSVRFMPINWSIILFARAYEKEGMFSRALEEFSKLEHSDEIEKAIKRIKRHILHNSNHLE